MCKHQNERGERRRQSDQGTRRTEGRRRGDDEFAAIPGRDELRYGVGQRIHDALLNVRWRREVTSSVRHLRHALPELDIPFGAAAHGCFGQLTIQPCMDGWGENAARIGLHERNLTIGERTLELRPLFSFVAAIEAVVGPNIIKHVRRTSPLVMLAVPHERDGRAS
jgi:hypothetical protein